MSYRTVTLYHPLTVTTDLTRSTPVSLPKGAEIEVNVVRGNDWPIRYQGRDYVGDRMSVWNATGPQTRGE